LEFKHELKIHGMGSVCSKKCDVHSCVYLYSYDESSCILNTNQNFNKIFAALAVLGLEDDIYKILSMSLKFWVKL